MRLRMLQYIKRRDLVLGLLLCLGIRSMISGDSIALAAIAIVAGAVYSYTIYLESKIQKDINLEVKEELENVKNLVNGLSIKSTIKPAYEEKRFF